MREPTPLSAERAEALEAAVHGVARDLFASISQGKPSLLSAERRQSELMELAIADERLKVELFRFVDVFPTLRTAGEIDRHLREYFGQPGLPIPRLLQAGLEASSHCLASSVAAAVIRRQMLSFAQRFIVGRDADDALRRLRRLRRQGVGFTLDVLGEASVGEAEARDYQERYLRLLDGLHEEVASWPPDPAIDQASWGPLPRVNVSIKITSLHSQIDALDFRGSVEAVKGRLRPVFRKALATGAFVNLDLEQFRYRDLTYAVFKELLDEAEFAGYDQAGVVVQAYLRDAEADIAGLIDWARERGRVLTVRLVKGAYWDYETVQAEQEGWPSPVFIHKPDTDVSYERITRTMLEHPGQLRPAFASHNVRSLANVIATAEALGLPSDAYEIQMLHGMGEPIKAAIRARGLRLREYAPVGELIPGMAYFVRRLLENTANESFLRLTFAEGLDVERLIRAPQPSSVVGRATRRLPGSASTVAADPSPFRNQPRLDFARQENRTAFATALERVRSGAAPAGVGRHWPLVIDGRLIETAETLISVDPSRPERIVGTTGYAGTEEAERAVAASRAAFPAWCDAPASERAGVLFRAAELMRGELFELAALEVYEAGKTWREADADVGEAIDFLEYYGREALRLQEPGPGSHEDPRGRSRALRPRGVTLVVAPWNFPLAILTGMTSAALVAGNTVIVKPAGPTPVIAAQLIRVLHAAGAPPGTVNYLPSPGGTVGEALVRHPEVDMIAFTGSKDVGLRIIREAAVHPARSGPKCVVAEMGGKNAIIVDEDADLDVAVLESVVSAFHYQGQKCSAASRIIVVSGAYNEFVKRFADAARSVRVGPPEDPASRMGPVINAAAKENIERYIEQGRREGREVLAAGPPPGGWPGDGYYVGPHIFADVSPDALIAQEEIFGPVVAVMRARDMDEALAIANGTQYALTGGLVSRSPATIARARREFRVGNLYINRGITGALVERQAFGGFKMSGVGSKAGGPDYLPQFMRPAPAAPPDTSDELTPSRPTPSSNGDPDTAWRAARSAVARAAATVPAMRELPVAAGAAAAGRAARLVERNSRELQARLLEECDGRGEQSLLWSAQEVRQAAVILDELSHLIGDVHRVRRMGHQPGELNQYFYEGRGLVLVLGSSGRPLTSICLMAGAALVAGNPVVIMPGRRAGEGAGYLAGLLAAAGFPADAVMVIPAAGPHLCDALVGHPDVAVAAVSGGRAAVDRVVAVAGRATARDRVRRVVTDTGFSPAYLPDAHHIVQFLEPRVVTENTLRRGFAPAEDVAMGAQ